MASDIVQIVTDSTCALPPELDPAVRAHPHIVRTSVQFGEQSYPEGTLPLDEFYRRIGAGGAFPQTSQPAPGEYLHAYQEAAPHGPILALFMSGALSGTYASGVALARELPGADILCFDSRTFSSGLGYMVAEASEMALAGASREAILARMRWRRAHTRLFIAIDKMEYLRRSGRINVIQAGLASVLDLKPILAVDEQGALAVTARVRSRQRSLERLVELACQEAAAKLPGPLWASAMHGQAPTVAAQLLESLKQRLPIERSFVSEAPASVALHGGPGVVGVMLTSAGERDD